MSEQSRRGAGNGSQSWATTAPALSQEDIVEDSVLIKRADGGVSAVFRSEEEARKILDAAGSDWTKAGVEEAFQAAHIAK